MIEKEEIPSRIASLHYSYYSSVDDLEIQLKEKSEEIQCVIGSGEVLSIPSFHFGQAQNPGLSDYADGVDTVAFLLSL